MPRAVLTEVMASGPAVSEDADRKAKEILECRVSTLHRDESLVRRRQRLRSRGGRRRRQPVSCKLHGGLASPIGVAPGDPTVVPPMHAVLQQKNKAFEPHLLVATKGSTVDFPNRDPWFHNVFSLFNGKRLAIIWPL